MTTPKPRQPSAPGEPPLQHNPSTPVPQPHASCRIVAEQARLRGLIVTSAHATFPVNLDGVPVEVHLAQDATHAHVDVKAAWRFSGAYPVDQLNLRLAAQLDLNDGRICIGKGAAPTLVSVRDDGLEVSLERATGVAIQPAPRVPCSRLGLSDRAAHESSLRTATPAERSVGTGSRFVPLNAQPTDDAPISIRYPGPFVVKEQRPGWVLLAAEWQDGSRVKGWTRKRHVVPYFDDPPQWIGGLSGHGACGRMDAPRRSPLRIAEGAPVSTAPDGAVWAHASREVAVEAIAVTLERADGWIKIAEMPGLEPPPCQDLKYSWVHRRHVVQAR